MVMSNIIISQKFLHDVGFFFSHLKGFPHSVLYYDDGIIQTDHGCYRLALEKNENGKNYIALFYGRDPSDLLDDPSAPPDASDILYKDRVVLIEMREIHQTDIDNQPLNIGWVPAAIARTEHDLSQSNLLETCLHRVSDSFYISKFFAYKIEGEPGKRQIIVTSRLHATGEIITPSNGLPAGLAFDACSKEVNGHRGHSLKVVIDLDNDAEAENVHRYPLEYFADEIVSSVMLKHISVYIDRLWEARDPLTFLDDPIEIALRMQESAAEYLKSLRESLNSPEKVLRSTLPLAASALIAGGGTFVLKSAIEAIQSTMTDTALEKVSEIGSHHHTPMVPHERFNLVDIHFPRTHHTESGIHKAAMRCNPKNFGGLRWITNPSAFTFAERFTPVRRDPETAFAHWMVTYVANPRKTIWSYYDGDGSNSCQSVYQQNCVALGYASNGIRLTYVRETGLLYAYYHAPEIFPSHRKLVPSAEGRFQSNSVIVIDTKDVVKKTTVISFDAFLARMPGNLRSKFPVPQQPSPEVLSERPPVRLPNIPSQPGVDAQPA